MVLLLVDVNHAFEVTNRESFTEVFILIVISTTEKSSAARLLTTQNIKVLENDSIEDLGIILEFIGRELPIVFLSFKCNLLIESYLLIVIEKRWVGVVAHRDIDWIRRLVNFNLNI